jgi:hypothetical protein
MSETVTSNVRGWGGTMFVVGAVACFTPAIAAGAVLAIVGGFMWWFAPANAERTQKMVDEAGQGGGCGAGLAAVLFVVIVMALAGLVAAGAGVVLIGGGL